MAGLKPFGVIANEKAKNLHGDYKLMDTQAIFGLQFFLSLVVWGVIAKWLLAPWLEKMSSNEALSWLALPHAFRHIGMAFLVPGVVARPLPEAFAGPAAYGGFGGGPAGIARIHRSSD